MTGDGQMVPDSWRDQLDEYLRQTAASLPGWILGADPAYEPKFQYREMVIDQKSVMVPIPESYLMDYGIIPDTRPRYVPKRETFRQAMRRRRVQLRDWLAVKAYETISGETFPDEDDDW